MNMCQKHPFDKGIGACQVCNWDYCVECLVYPHGASHPPYCVSCALAAAGVRSNAAVPKRPKELAPRRGLFRRTPEPVAAPAAVPPLGDAVPQPALTPAAFANSLPAMPSFASLSREPATMGAQGGS